MFGSSDSVEFDQLELLPYMTQVINECLRLYPPAPATVRDVRAGARLAGYTMPADCAVIVSERGYFLLCSFALCL